MSEGASTPGWAIGLGRRVITGSSVKRSRFVRLMRVFLPLSAVALVATVVAWPGPDSGGQRFQLSFSSEDGGAPPLPGMTRARYVGSDENDQPFVITADRALQSPDNPETVALENLQADITLESGTWLALTAASGLYHRDLSLLWLDGPVTLFSDNGFEFHAASAEIDLARGTVRSDQPVRGQGPLGLIDAQSFRIVKGDNRLFFTGDVKLVVYPDAPG